MNPELAWKERSRARVRKAVKMGSGDASDAMDAEQCIISITKGCGGYLDYTILEKSGWMYWGQYGSWLAATSAYQKRGPCR